MLAATFLEQVARRSFMPSGQSTFTDAEMLSIASEELSTKIYPRLLQANEEYFVSYKDVTISSGVSSYNIPESAYNNTLREVQIISGGVVYDIAREDLTKTNRNSSLSAGMPYFFYMKDNSVVLFPNPNTTATLRMWFIYTPSDLVEATDTAVISSIDTNTNTVTLSSIPASWVTADRFDLITQKNGHSMLAIDSTSTLVSGLDIAFSSLPSGLVVGDYVSRTGQTSVIQLPKAMIPVLAQYTAAAVLEYAGQSGFKEAKMKADEMLNEVLTTVTPRVKGEIQYIKQTFF